MVQKIALAFLGFIAIFAIAGTTLHFRDSATGLYTTGSNIGRWHVGTQKVQLQPDEACMYAGAVPLYPWRVYTNEYGTLMSMCKVGDSYVGVPIVQTAFVPAPAKPSVWS